MIIYFTVTRPLRFFCIFQHFKEGRPTSENPDREPASRYETVTPARRPPKDVLPRNHQRRKSKPHGLKLSGANLLFYFVYNKTKNLYLAV